MSACAGNILKEMTECFIGAELLSRRAPRWEAKNRLPFHCTTLAGAALLHSTFRICNTSLT